MTNSIIVPLARSYLASEPHSAVAEIIKQLADEVERLRSELNAHAQRKANDVSEPVNTKKETP